MRIILAIAAFTVTAMVLFGLSNSKNNTASFVTIPQHTSNPTPSSTPRPTTSKTTTKVVVTAKPTLTPPSTSSGLPSVSAPSFDINLLSTLPLTFKIKQQAKLEIRTVPQAQCGIKVTLPSGTTSGASGLTTKTTDLTGYASWSWNISWNTKVGSGKIDLNCTKDQLKSSKNFGFTITQ